MTWRLLYWFGGMIAILFLVGGAHASASIESGLAAFAAWLIGGLLGEVLSLVRSRRRARRAGASTGTIAERDVVVPVADIPAEPNPIDARFSRAIPPTPGSGGETRPRPATSRSTRSLARGERTCAVGSIFLGRDGEPWSDAEMAAACLAVQRAVEWIGREAGAWDVALTFHVASSYVAVTDAHTRAESPLELQSEEHQAGLADPTESVAVVSAVARLLEQQGWTGPAAVFQAFERGIETGRLVWLVHSRSAGRSHWVADALDGRLAICYAEEAAGPGPLTRAPFSDPVTFVHELLHMFGATDKYGVSSARFGPGMVGENDVMLLHHERLSRLVIDPLTARELGWYGGGAFPPRVAQRCRCSVSRHRGGSVVDIPQSESPSGLERPGA